MDHLEPITDNALSPMADLSITDVTPVSTTSDEGGIPVPTTHPKIITLNVGGRKFQTELATLTEGSGLLRRMLSPSWNWEAQADGSYFLDADAELFEHLLRFMRRPETFPLFYTKADGFGYDLYNRLEAEARYYQMDTLENWLKGKIYLQAVICHTRDAIVQNLDSFSVKTIPTYEFEEHHMIPRKKKVYICPRGIFVHHGDKDRCGQACRRAQGDDDEKYEEQRYVEVVTIKKEIEFVRGVCNVL